MAFIFFYFEYAGPPIPPPAAGVTSPANRGTVARAKVAAGHWSTATVMVAGLLVVVDDGRTRRPAGRSGPQVQTALLHRDWQSGTPTLLMEARAASA